MRTYVLTLFVLFFLETLFKLSLIVNGNYAKPRTLPEFTVSVIVTSTFAIWAGFVLWY